MPIWQDHEQRITALEVTMTNLSSKMDSVERTVKETHGEQKELLNTLIEHHLETNKMRMTNFWKFVLNITGAGGLLIAVVYAIIQFFD